VGLGIKPDDVRALAVGVETEETGPSETAIGHAHAVERRRQQGEDQIDEFFFDLVLTEKGDRLRPRRFGGAAGRATSRRTTSPPTTACASRDP